MVDFLSSSLSIDIEEEVEVEKDGPTVAGADGLGLPEYHEIGIVRVTLERIGLACLARTSSRSHVFFLLRLLF